MLIAIILLPLLNFIFIAITGRFIGYKGVMRLTLMNLLASITLSVYFLFCTYRKTGADYVKLGN